MKLLNHFSNNKPHDPHGYKEEVKIKYDSVKVIAGNFPNGTTAMMVLLAAEAVLLDWVVYCALTPDKQFVWEERGNELNKAMLYLINSKNKHAKKDLRLAYSQENMTAYPLNIEAWLDIYQHNIPTTSPPINAMVKRGYYSHKPSIFE